jgi:hypothetical protein
VGVDVEAHPLKGFDASWVKRCQGHRCRLAVQAQHLLKGFAAKQQEDQSPRRGSDHLVMRRRRLARLELHLE